MIVSSPSVPWGRVNRLRRPHRQGSGVRGGVGTPGQGWAGERIHSVTQVLHTGGDREAPRPDAQGAPTRLRGPRLSAAMGTPSRPRGAPATGSELDLTGPPGSPPPAHTCRRVTPAAAACARPPRPGHSGRPCPERGPRQRPSPPGGQTHQTPAPWSACPTPPPPPAPRALTPLPALSPPRALTREDTHTLHLSLTGRPRAARSRGRPRPPGRPALTGR